MVSVPLSYDQTSREVAKLSGFLRDIVSMNLISPVLILLVSNSQKINWYEYL